MIVVREIIKDAIITKAHENSVEGSGIVKGLRNVMIEEGTDDVTMRDDNENLDDDNMETIEEIMDEDGDVVMGEDAAPVELAKNKSVAGIRELFDSLVKIRDALKVSYMKTGKIIENNTDVRSPWQKGPFRMVEHDDEEDV